VRCVKISRRGSDARRDYRRTGGLDRLPYEALTRLRAKCAATLATIESAQLIAANVARRQKDDIGTETDRMLTPDEAAVMLRRSRQWIYRNAHRLPFVKRLSRKSLLCSEAGMKQWLASRRA
jgi:hypothetical protein